MTVPLSKEHQQQTLVPATRLRALPLMRGIFVATTSLLLVACGNSWVQLTPQGQQVQLATTAQISNCQRAGTANVNAADSIGFVQRSARQLQEELVTLARNEAGNIGGNRVVPESTINDGRQTFGIFRC